MASPQKENGYTAISNELYEALCHIRISGEAEQCLKVIIRKTYGFNKKKDSIALKTFEVMTGMKKPEICRGLAKLQTMKLIIGEKSNSRNIATTYGLNKNYEEWLAKMPTLAKKPTSIGENANDKTEKPLRHIEGGLAKMPPSKDIILKDKVKDIPEASSGEIAELIKSFEDINPACKSFYGRPPQREACRNLIASYGFLRVKGVIEKTLPKTNGLPFFPTITTPIQLCDKWAALEAQIIKNNNKAKQDKEKSGNAFW